MGLNVNLVQMLGLPKKVECPHCHKMFSPHFDDFDIECYEPRRGVIEIMGHECPHCEKLYNVRCKVELVETLVTKARD